MAFEKLWPPGLSYTLSKHFKCHVAGIFGPETHPNVICQLLQGLYLPKLKSHILNASVTFVQMRTIGIL